jgi:hypothetical protein
MLLLLDSQGIPDACQLSSSPKFLSRTSDYPQATKRPWWTAGGCSNNGRRLGSGQDMQRAAAHDEIMINIINDKSKWHHVQKYAGIH